MQVDLPNAAKGESHLDREMAFLFGERVVEQSRRLTVDELVAEADQVAEGARQLREQAGHPERQKAIIEAMDADTALALCKWLREPGCMAPFIARGVN